MKVSEQGDDIVFGDSDAICEVCENPTFGQYFSEEVPTAGYPTPVLYSIYWHRLGEHGAAKFEVFERFSISAEFEGLASPCPRDVR